MKTPTRWTLAITLVVGFLQSAMFPCFAQESHIGNLIGEARRGKQHYRRYCIGCHGPRGDGAGENAPWVTPQPRDFTAGLFKCRSTPSGSIPYDDDIFNSITRGYVTTNMPTWVGLNRQERADLVAYIKTLTPRFKEEKPEPPIKIAPETPDTPESVARGKELFQQMKCWECHGQEGRGNGPSASTLRDNKGNPIPPYDFSTGERFKCGTSNEDLYRIFLTGLDGTPMPSFADYLQPNQAWDLVHFLRTLQVNYKGKKVMAAATPLAPQRQENKAAPSEKK
jgi:mono/diheme cytochrome c family protein